MQLAPEELGRIRFSINQNDGLVSMVISADRPETLLFLRRHAGELSAELTQLGLRDSTLDFHEPEHGGSGSHTQQDTTAQLSQHELTEDQLQHIAAVEGGQLSAAGRLDLRL